MVFDSDDSDSDCNPQENEASTGGQHEEGQDDECPWKSAVDPGSGRTYYYHIKTRETQWRKPIEMASREERDAIEAKERRQKDFFAAMEANILKSISAGKKAPEKNSLLDEEYENKEISDEPLATSELGVVDQQNAGEITWIPPPSVAKNGTAALPRPDLVRTISTMDTSVLRELIKRVPSSRINRSQRGGLGIGSGSGHSIMSGMSGSSSRSMSGRSLGGGGSSHLNNRQRLIRGTPQLATAPRNNNLKKSASSEEDTSGDELPPLTVVTTPDLRATEMKKMASLRLGDLKNERAHSMRLDELCFDDGVMESDFFQESNGWALSNRSFQLDPDEPPGLVNHNSRSQSSFAGQGSFSSFDSSKSFEGDVSNSIGNNISISSNLHPVEEGMDESDKSITIRTDPKEIVLNGRDDNEIELGGSDNKEIVLNGRVDLGPPQESSFSVGTEGSGSKGSTTANWLDGLPEDNEDRIEELVGYGNSARPSKDAGYASFFDESMANFDLSEQETQALQKLALISEQMTQVMESEESDEDFDDEEDEEDVEGGYPDFNKTDNGAFELDFEESEESLASESEESSVENGGAVKSSPSFRTPITASSTKTSATSVSSGSPTQAAPKRKLVARNTRIPRTQRNKLVADNGEESGESSSPDESSSGKLGVAGFAGATLTTDNPRSHVGATLMSDNAKSHLGATYTTDNARSLSGTTTKGYDGSSSSSLYSQDTMSSSKKRSIRMPNLGRLRSSSTKGGLSLGSPDVARSLTMSSSARSHSIRKRDMSKRPDLIRRNTCGTLYVGTTMSAPDKDATIKCVSGVYRAHILQSEMAEEEPDWTHFRVFNDLESQQGKVPKNAHRSRKNTNTTIPSLEQITTFYRDVFQRAQMEYDCIIISLIYVERLIKTTNGALRPRSCNWRSVLFSCMVLASKVWDDLSMWNADFSQTCPSGISFPLKRVNELEVAILSALSYKVKVPASEYAKYYFLLRTMLIKSGLVGDTVDTASPLDVEGAKRLQQVSTQYQSGMNANKRQIMRKTKSMRNPARSKSMGEAERDDLNDGAKKGGVSLEHVVHM